jgi:hypothetical protein
MNLYHLTLYKCTNYANFHFSLEIHEVNCSLIWKFMIIIPPHNKVVRGVYWNQLVRPSVRPSGRRFFLVRPIT